MAEKENGEDPQVNLELPSIGFGRKKRRQETPQTAEPAEETRPLYVDDLPPEESPPAPVAEDKPAPAPKPPREPRPPIITGMPAAIVTGLLVGGLAVGLTYLGMLGCEGVQGTDSCGGPGFFILVAIMVLMVVTGSWLLKLFEVTDPGSTSFLAVGLAVVIALLFLIDVIFEWWMVIAMPLVFVATYALAHWVTVRYIEPASHD